MKARPPPDAARTRDGGFVASGYLAELDEQRTLRDQSRKVIAELQARYASESGIQTLKIRHNNVLGYFVETPAKHAEHIRTQMAAFIHRQTMANAARRARGDLTFTTSSVVEALVDALDRPGSVGLIVPDASLATARAELSEFFARPTTFSLGVCNGCQMLSNLAELIPGAQGFPRFVRNRSEQFEARFVLAEVQRAGLSHVALDQRWEGRQIFPATLVGSVTSRAHQAIQRGLSSSIGTARPSGASGWSRPDTS